MDGKEKEGAKGEMDISGPPYREDLVVIDLLRLDARTPFEFGGHRFRSVLEFLHSLKPRRVEAKKNLPRDLDRRQKLAKGAHDLEPRALAVRRERRSARGVLGSLRGSAEDVIRSARQRFDRFDGSLDRDKRRLAVAKTSKGKWVISWRGQDYPVEGTKHRHLLFLALKAKFAANKEARRALLRSLRAERRQGGLASFICFSEAEIEDQAIPVGEEAYARMLRLFRRGLIKKIRRRRSHRVRR